MFLFNPDLNLNKLNFKKKNNKKKMSLFQNKEWWGLKVGENEEFDAHHLCVAPLNPSNPNENYIILGSYQGKLRIFLPKFREYRIEDLLFEKDFQMPIIQVIIGKFVPTSAENALCVLFFKKISVFSINFSNNGINCKLLYENNLPRNAYNMVAGPFGGGKHRDFICVQSCDGFLMIYEQDKFASLSQLNEYILPSPIYYVEVTDSFILQNSSFELESYRYSSIGANFNSQKENKALYPDWTINLGEASRKMVGFWRTEKTFEIFILCETMLYVVSHTGALITQKKLEFPPSNIHMYDNSLKGKNMIYEQGQNPENVPVNFATYVISSFTHHILVYKDFQLIWASKTNNIAHGVEIAMFEGQKGLITTINDEGWLEVIFNIE